MSMNLSDAKAAIQSATSIDKIIEVIEGTSARMQGAPAGAVSVLYNGSVDGRSSYLIAQQLPSAHPDHVIIDRTPIGELLFDGDTKRKIRELHGAEIKAGNPNLSQAKALNGQWTPQ